MFGWKIRIPMLSVPQDPKLRVLVAVLLMWRVPQNSKSIPAVAVRLMGCVKVEAPPHQNLRVPQNSESIPVVAVLLMECVKVEAPLH
jgi:hypothetical protein